MQYIAEKKQLNKDETEVDYLVQIIITACRLENVLKNCYTTADLQKLANKMN